MSDLNFKMKKMILLILEDAPKDLTTLLWIICGVLASAVFTLAVKYDKLLRQSSNEKNNQLALQISQSDKEKEEYKNIIEKTLNALTGFDKTLMTSSIDMLEKLMKAFKEGNEPLIREIRKLLDK